jgi:hypothetical protein
MPKPFINCVSPNARPEADCEPEDGADEPENERLGEHGALHHPARRAQRAQHPELARALEHGHVERVEDQEPADEQRDAGEEVEDHVERLQLLADVVADTLRRLHIDAVAEPGLQAALQRGDVAAVGRRDAHLQ